jgi:hypothetical protein
MIVSVKSINHMLSSTNELYELIDDLGRNSSYYVRNNPSITVYHNHGYNNKETFYLKLNCILSMDINNPNETIDRFMKLLVLK